MPIKIVIAEDHTLVRQAIVQVLQNNENFEILGEASNGREAVCLVQKLLPDIVIMDIGMSELNGIDATRQIVSQYPGVKVIALSQHNDKRYVFQMLEAGASGYLLKDSLFNDLVDAIYNVDRNNGYLSGKIAHYVIEGYTRKGVNEPNGGAPLLSPREREILQLLAEGKTSREIASTLFISPKTVENHRKRITDKLNLHSIAELTKYAIRNGLTTI